MRANYTLLYLQEPMLRQCLAALLAAGCHKHWKPQSSKECKEEVAWLNDIMWGFRCLGSACNQSFEGKVGATNATHLSVEQLMPRQVSRPSCLPLLLYPHLRDLCVVANASKTEKKV